jgi:hypothetical protein
MRRLQLPSGLAPNPVPEKKKPAPGEGAGWKTHLSE